MKRLCLPLALLALAASPLFAQIPGDITLDPAFGGASFSFPVGVRHADDNSDRKFVIERAGTIRVVDAGGTVLAEPFLDISALTSTTGERGLLGLAFHPDYASNGRVYINHTANNVTGVPNGDTMIVEYQVDPLDPDELDPNSREVILVIPQDFSNHNGGDLHFGPDGFLYIGMGDGGSGNDPCNRGQTLDPSTSPDTGCRTGEDAWLLGKMLRIDIDSSTPAGSNNLCGAGPDGSANYAIPSDNPFVGQSNRCGEVWSFGQRNPYRFSFDRDTGDLWVGDVGQNTWEEINLEPATSSGGENYGWKICEGNWLRGSQVDPCTLPDHSGPVVEYSSASGSSECSVTGGYRYRGPVTSMQGYYVYGDYCSGKVWFAEQSTPGNWTSEQFGTVASFSLVGFGEDEDGNVYATLANGNILVFDGDTVATYSVGGTVSGLEGSGLVLQNNGGDDLTVNSDGAFTFATELESGETYSVTVETQPSGPLQECTVSQGSGTIGSADVEDVEVVCVTLDDVVFEDRFKQL